MPRTAASTRSQVSTQNQSALYFGNRGAVVTVSNASPLQSFSALTIEAFINIDTNPGYLSRIVEFIGGSNTGFNVELNTGRLIQTNIANGSGTGGVQSVGSVTLNTRRHIAVTWDGTRVRIFINGVLDSNTASLSGGTTGNPNTPFLIGNSSGVNRGFPGSIEGIKVSNIVRYTATFTPPTTQFTSDSNTKALWLMNEGSDRLIYDSSGNSLTGSFSKSPQPDWIVGSFSATRRQGTTDLRIPSYNIVKTGSPRGMSLSGMEFGSSTFPGTEGVTFYQNSNDDYLYAAGKGFNIIKVPILWERLQPAVNGSLDATYKSYIDNNIAWAKDNGLKIVLELHNYGGRYISGVNYKIGTAQVTQAHFNDFWTKVATAYVNESGVYGYGLMNEPGSMPVPTTPSNYNTTATWTLAAQAAITAIRAVDTSKYLFACTDGNGSNGGSFTANYGTNPTPWLVDSANKLYIEVHQYFSALAPGTADEWFSGTNVAITFGGDKLLAVLNWGAANNQPICVGEYGWPNYDDAFTVEGNNMLNVIDKYPGTATFHWAFSSHYGAITTISPLNSYTVDRRQMYVVGRHLGTL